MGGGAPRVSVVYRVRRLRDPPLPNGGRPTPLARVRVNAYEPRKSDQSTRSTAPRSRALGAGAAAPRGRTRSVVVAEEIPTISSKNADAFHTYNTSTLANLFDITVD